MGKASVNGLLKVLKQAVSEVKFDIWKNEYGFMLSDVALGELELIIKRMISIEYEEEDIDE
ncbi:MAG: hypothetical protein RSC24_06485 [Clostridium sp.]